MSSFIEICICLLFTINFCILFLYGRKISLAINELDRLQIQLNIIEAKINNDKDKLSEIYGG